jgi:acetoin utilization deacetylase AcuC-like enzyme
MFSGLFQNGLHFKGWRWPWRRTRVAAVYHEDYTTGHTVSSRKGIFDPLRALRIRQAIQNGTQPQHVRWLTPEVATREQLERVHPSSYLAEAALPHFLAEVFAMHRIDPWDTDLWDSIRLATGGTIKAVEHALETGLTTFNLSGGFHHAGPTLAAGYCVLNDVAVAIAQLRARGFTEDVAVVDLDYHHGNGNEACLLNDKHSWIFSVHPELWQDTGKTEIVHKLVDHAIHDAKYLQTVAEGLRELESHCRPRLVIYLAGCDPWEDDALCDMQISQDAILRRDLCVASWASRLQAPLAVVLAGGYGQQSWTLTARFIEALASERPIP